MAKGLRSKEKRANRTKLRNEITIPAIAARQEIISKKISNDLAKSTGKSISNLKIVFGQKKIINAETSKGNSQSTDNAIQGLGENKAKLQRYSQLKLPTMNKLSTGKKPRNNPNKELVWFGAANTKS